MNDDEVVFTNRRNDARKARLRIFRARFDARGWRCSASLAPLAAGRFRNAGQYTEPP